MEHIPKLINNFFDIFTYQIEILWQVQKLKLNFVILNDKNQYLQYNIVFIGLIWHHVIRDTIKNDAKLPIKCMHWYLDYKSETLDTWAGVI